MLHRNENGIVELNIPVNPTDFLKTWIEDVRLNWELEWRDRPPVAGELHRYTKDFAAFVGERFLTDFGFR